MPTVLITGANRGIGLELVRQYVHAGWRVVGGCRDPRAATDLQALVAQGDLRVQALDVVSGESVRAARKALADEPVDVLINNAGVFGPKPEAESDPGQSFGTVRYEAFDEVLRINTLAPLRVTEAFVDAVAASEQRKIVTISSGLGSIADTTGGYLAYRASKAAVNMLMASLAVELRPRGICVSMLCPGWVRTRMGGSDAPLSPEVSVRGIRARIAELDANNTGEFRLYDGTRLRW
jgi:NAD(P)-dependent dehydrogenase (short-subunit alcohol dehydrogenase family)